MSTLRRRVNPDYHDKPAVTVYVTPTCQACPKTLRVLRDHQISHTVVDLTKDKTAYTHVTQELKFKAAPVVDVLHRFEQNTWSGHQPELIAEHILQHYQPSDDDLYAIIDDPTLAFEKPIDNTPVTSGYGQRTRSEFHGPTGNTTGPHLHFRATEEGQA